MTMWLVRRNNNFRNINKGRNRKSRWLIWNYVRRKYQTMDVPNDGTIIPMSSNFIVLQTFYKKKNMKRVHQTFVSPQKMCKLCYLRRTKRTSCIGFDQSEYTDQYAENLPLSANFAYERSNARSHNVAASSWFF